MRIFVSGLKTAKPFITTPVISCISTERHAFLCVKEKFRNDECRFCFANYLAIWLRRFEERVRKTSRKQRKVMKHSMKKSRVKSINKRNRNGHKPNNTTKIKRTRKIFFFENKPNETPVKVNEIAPFCLIERIVALDDVMTSLSGS